MSKAAPQQRILIYDPDLEYVRQVYSALSKIGYDLKIADSEKQFFATVEDYSPHLIVLTLDTDRTALEVCARFRKSEEGAIRPIVFVAGEGSEENEVDCFEAGADDFQALPLRLRALSKRFELLYAHYLELTKRENIIRYGSLTIDTGTNVIEYKGVPYNFPPTSFEILTLLVCSPGKIFSRQALLRKLWGGQNSAGLKEELSPRSIDVHIWTIRQALGEQIITTFKGKGYKINVEIGEMEGFK
jgi:DNA-binding response OmpR family regulator